jgi:competence protein ComFC
VAMDGLKPPPAYWLYRFFWNALDWVFPPKCGGCGALGERWCTTCQQKTTPIGKEVCHCCGIPLAGGGLCIQCQDQPPAVTAIRSWAVYQGPVREAIHHLKYSRHIGMGEILARHQIDTLAALPWRMDLVTCVPLSTQRKKQRGYNQSSMLARPVALALKIPYRPGLLERTRETISQVGLSASQRRLNVAGAFQSEAGSLQGLSVLVIDDVTTTGSTLNACAQALKDAGAAAVYGLTVARAVTLESQRSDSLNPIL